MKQTVELECMPVDESKGDDKEIYIDVMIIALNADLDDI